MRQVVFEVGQSDLFVWVIVGAVAFVEASKACILELLDIGRIILFKLEGHLLSYPGI